MNLTLQSLPAVAGILVLIESENLDAGNAPAFKEAIQPCLEEASVLVLDMSRLDFVDSSGLGAMLACLRAMNSKRGQLKLIGMSSNVRALFELVRMHRIFSIHDTCDDALASL